MARAVALGTPADWLLRARHDRALPDGEKLCGRSLRVSLSAKSTRRSVARRSSGAC